ncbi:hypothetical protein OsI_08830 [Oryza sativa Indica Group]|uniref:Uncharacterized protein n=1 Tax=Oryza sativa subsp. indica TaxID=39946 RepID=A2X9B2_ORYSI|nr:hypothetical protein OsI_08830 [Oryza sativa Indica Group]
MAAAGGGGSVGAAALEAVMAVEGQEATPSAEGGMRGAGVVEARLAARPRARLCHCLRGLSRFKSFHTLVFGEAFVFLGPLSSCGGQHALRLFLLMTSEQLADGVRQCSTTMTCCSLFYGVGASRVKEVAPWWLG